MNTLMQSIYCISVLEHTKNYKQIIDEFYNVLKTGGKLILTFDISLDGRNDISPQGATKLINSLTKFFKPDDELVPITKQYFKSENILTTKYAYRINPDLLWTSTPHIQAFWGEYKIFIQGQELGFLPANVYCLLSNLDQN